MKKIIKFAKQVGIMGIMVVVILAFSIQPVSAGYDGYSKTIHKGKYYFKFDYGKEQLLISKKKRGKYRKTPVHDPNFVTNGKEVVFLSKSGSKFYIKRYVISSKKQKKLKKLPKADVYATQAVNGKYMWLCDLNRKILYRYNIGTNKLKRVKRNINLFHLKKSYCLAWLGEEKELKTIQLMEGYHHTIWTCNMAIYKVTKTGKLRKIKNLGNVNCSSDDMFSVFNYGKVKTFYYATGSGHKLYQINYNGKKKKLLKSFSGVILGIEGNRCGVFQNNKVYQYNIKTGTMQESDPELY